MEKLSAYILTKNSELHLANILEPLSKVADEILIIDSGSNDQTESIARGFEKVKFIYHEFKDFKDQRTFAADSCTHDMVLFLDSDEIPDDDFIESIRQLKENGFEYDAYKALRKWNVLGRYVHSIYPVSCPDGPIRLYRKSKVGFSSSGIIHEAIWGFSTYGVIGGFLHHITFQTKEELARKLEFYTDLAAQDILQQNKSVNAFKLLVYPIAQFLKWYIIRNGYKDGKVGLHLAVFAFKYSRIKFLKARTISSTLAQHQT